MAGTKILQIIDSTSKNVRYYDNLALALEDINSSTFANVITDKDIAAVRVDVGDSEYTLTLLKNVEQSGQLTIGNNMNLLLNGHKLLMSYAGDNITVAAGAALSIDGTREGSAVLVDSNSKAAVLARAHGALNINGGQYSVSGGGASATVAAFVSTSSCPVLSLHDCSILADASTAKSTIGIQSQAARLDVQEVEITVNGTISTQAQYMNEACFSNVRATSTASGGNAGIKAFPNSNTTINNMQIFSESATNFAYGLQIEAGATLTAKDLRISAVTHAELEVNVSAFGISNYGICTIDDSIILADSKGSAAEGACSVGIDNNDVGTMTCRNTQATATHSGIQNEGNLHVGRCLLGSVRHGGLYTLHDYGKEVVINDTVLEGGVYRGQFTDIYADLFGPTTNPGEIMSGAALYFGQHNIYEDGGDMYMDSCIFVGLCNEAIVIRSAAYTENGIADGKHPNRLFISRSKIAAQKTWAEVGQIPSIRLNRNADAVYTTAFAELFIGVGCNFTVDNVQLTEDVAPYVHSAEVLYRENDHHLPTYEEYYTLMASQGQGGNDSSLNDVSAALDSIIAMQEELIGV